MSFFQKMINPDLTLEYSVRINLELIINERNNVFDELNFQSVPDFFISESSVIANFLLKKIQRYETRLSNPVIFVEKASDPSSVSASGSINIRITGKLNGEEKLFCFNLDH